MAAEGAATSSGANETLGRRGLVFVAAVVVVVLVLLLPASGSRWTLLLAALLLLLDVAFIAAQVRLQG